MVRCPWCGEEVETGKYTEHLEKCPEAQKKAPTTLKDLMKGRVLNGFLEAAKVRPLTEFVEKKLSFTERVLGLDAAVQLRNKKLVQTIRSDKEIEGLAERDLVTITLDDREIAKAVITSIDKVRLSELAKDDAERGGFPTLPHLEDALKRAGFRFKPLSEYIENRVLFTWEKREETVNWVVTQRSKQTKEHVKSMGVETEEEAFKIAQQWHLDLIRSGKDRWYEVVVRKPTGEEEVYGAVVMRPVWPPTAFETTAVPALEKFEEKPETITIEQQLAKVQGQLEQTYPIKREYLDAQGLLTREGYKSALASMSIQSLDFILENPDPQIPDLIQDVREERRKREGPELWETLPTIHPELVGKRVKTVEFFIKKGAISPHHTSGIIEKTVKSKYGPELSKIRWEGTLTPEFGWLRVGSEVVVEEKPEKKPLSSEETRILQTHKFVPKQEIYHLTDDKESILKSDRIFTRAGGMLSLTANPKLAHVLPERELARKFRLVLDFQKLKEDLGIALFPVYYVTEKEWYETKPPSWLIDYYRKTDVTFYQDVEAWNTAPMIYMDIDLFAEESEWKSKTDIFPVKKYLIRVEEVETEEKKPEEVYKRKEYPVEEWYVLYAPHQKPPYYQFEYKIMGSWNTLRFEKFEDLMNLLAKGREELYVHATRGKEIVTWKPLMIVPFTLKPDTKEETPAHIYTLVQPILTSDDPYTWKWKVSVYDKAKVEAEEREMTEAQWEAMWKRVSWQAWIPTVLGFITEKTKTEGWASHEQVHKEMEKLGMTHEEVDKVVAQLEREGTIYMPREGYYRKT